MKTIVFAAVSLLLLAYSPTARAGVYLEPDLGFEFGTSKQDFKYTNAAGTSSSNSQNGVTYGAALGFRKVSAP